MRSVITILFCSALLLCVSLTPASAQKKGKTAPIVKDSPSKLPPPDQAPPPSIPVNPTMVAIDDPHAGMIKSPPPFIVNITELHYGSQGVGVESCMYVTISNQGRSAQTMTNLFVDDAKHYTIPSPSHQMLPISVQPGSNVTISVCFKPEKVGEFKSRLVIKTSEDSVVVPVDGKGIKPEDVGKLPKTEMNFVWKKKGRTGMVKLQLIYSAKITLQLFDDLGNMKFSLLNNDFKNEGVYELPFECVDKDKKKLEPGSYYLRCVIDDVSHSNIPVKITKTVEITD